MVIPMKNSYQLINNLMGAYLNQDFDYICETDSIEGGVDYYISHCPAGILALLTEEFDLFISEHRDDPNMAFEELFHPEVLIEDIQEFIVLFKCKIIAAGKG